MGDTPLANPPLALDVAEETNLVWRMRRLAVCSVMFALAFVQSPGRVVPDTKLDLTLDPLQFMGRALTMWDSSGFGGQLQNQAYGYLFPIGPFYALGDALGVPAWAVQRLWWGVLLSVAILGVTTLARRLDIGSPGTQLLAGVAFALSPRILSTLGPVSAEAWPMALAPWVLVPLVVATRGGAYRRPAMLSGLVVGAMGGVNAALCLAAVMPAGLYLVTRRPGARSLRLLGWWVGSVIAATLWWVIPLLMLGRYSPPFLDYIETGDVTTAPTALVETLRGTSHWVAFLGPDLGSTWLAGHDLVSQPALILDTVIVAGVGLAGLCLRGMVERGWLITLLLVGVLAITFGHVGAGTALFSGGERDLLDGALAPLRNVHKFDPLVRLPLVLGLAHAAAVVPGRLRRLEGARLASAAVVGVLVVAVVGMGGPAYVGRVAPTGTFAEVPTYWEGAASWVEQHPGGRALLVPGSRFGVYGWGSPMDEPIQGLTDAPWDVRNAIPLVPAGHIRMLDAVEKTLAAGEPSPGLAAYLGRAGISYLVVRNDLDPTSSGATRPVLVHAVLDGSPGLTRAATFGPQVGGVPSDGLYVDDGLRATQYPAVEIWAVNGYQPRVTMTPESKVTQVTGGPESLLDLANVGLLPAAATVLQAQRPDWLETKRTVLTDGLQRREVDFGSEVENESRTLTAADPLRLDRPQSDYTISDDAADLTVAAWEGVDDVTVSSSLADAGVWIGSSPGDGPAAAFDGSDRTAWLADPSRGVSAWMILDLEQATPVPAVTVRLAAGGGAVSTVRVITDGQLIDTPVDGARSVTVTLSGQPTDSVQVELFRGPDSNAAFGISEVTVPGVSVRHVLQPPPFVVGQGMKGAVVFTAPTGHRDACAIVDTVSCSPLLKQSGEEDQQLNRRFDLSTAQTFSLDAVAAPLPGPRLITVIHEARRSRVPQLTARATSSLVADPLGGPLAAIDADVGTGWVAGPFDPDPGLILGWDAVRVVDGLAFDWADELAASRPTRVTVDSGKRSFRRAIDDGGHVSLPAVRTDGLTLHFSDLVPSFSYDETTERSSRLPVGISDVDVDGVNTAQLREARARVGFGCGEGPDLTVDGTLFRTRVSASIAHLASLDRVPVKVCGPADSHLAAGIHDVSLTGSGLWRPISVSLTGEDWHTDSELLPVAIDITSWSDSHRVIEVGARSEDYVLTVQENTNDGWVATVGGETLDPVIVDGWKQGYLVPAGTASPVVLDFQPAGGYRWALGVGFGLLLALLVGVALSRRGSELPPATLTRLPWWVAGALAAGALFCIGGWAGLGVVALTWVVRTVLRPEAARRPQLFESAWSSVALGSFVVAGGLLALWPWGTVDHANAEYAVQLACLLALAVLATHHSPPRRQ